MNQQINLYQPMFRRQQVVFSARTTLILAVGFLVLLAAWWWLLDRQVDSLAIELERQQTLEQQLAERLTRLNREMGERQPDPALVDEVEHLRQRARELEASRQLVLQRIPTRPVEVSERLAALGRKHPPGLWLTGIEIADNGREISLQGRVLNSPLLPEFLDGLGDEPVFSGQSFRHLRLEQPADGNPGLAFVISTRDPENLP
ncbi:MAG: PilN domain-containing protein [Wenzhouxiangellaceae bacterium]